MWTKQDGTLQPLLVDEDILLRRLADLVEEVGSDESSDEESGTVLFCFLCWKVIRINHIVEADESKHLSKN